MDTDKTDTCDKRLLILRAAAKVFGSKGFHEAKVGEIAEEAGVAKGTVYLYFKDKVNLLLEVAGYNIQMYVDGVREQVQQYESAKERLYAFARLHFAKFPELVRFHMVNMEQIMKFNKDELMRGSMRANQQKAFQLIVELIQYGIDRGELRADMDVNHGAMVYWGALHSYVHTLIVGVYSEKNDADAEALVDLVLKGIGS